MGDANIYKSIAGDMSMLIAIEKCVPIQVLDKTVYLSKCVTYLENNGFKVNKSRLVDLLRRKDFNE